MLVDLLRAGIAACLADGRPAGVALSGGLDSSTVACLAPADLPTFTGYYDMDGFDERPYAHLAKHRDHHDVLIEPEDFVTWFDAMCLSVRPPIMGMGTFGQFMVARAASRAGVQVMLSGEGSDELFGGYARQIIVAGEQPPRGFEKYVLPAGYPTTLAEALNHDWLKLPDLLAVDDQMCGAWGIEARAPFMDERVVSYGLNLPVNERVGKRHVRDRVRGIVPDGIIDRQEKMGFPTPLVAWAQEEPVRSFVLERIGYLPDPARPWDRSWWEELVRSRMP